MVEDVNQTRLLLVCGVLAVVIGTSCTTPSPHRVSIPSRACPYSFNKPPYINPRIIQDLTTSISDQGDQVVAINLSDSQNSNRYFWHIQTTNINGRDIISTKGPDSSFGYAYVGRISDVVVLETSMWNGGSGVFRNLMFVRLEHDQAISCDWDKGEVKAGKDRLLIKKVGEIALGDRWDGVLRVKGDAVYVGKDRGVFAGTDRGSSLSAVPKDRVLKIDLRERYRAKLECAKEVRLVGTIIQKRFPGSPNYEDIKKGDEPEDYWILKLRRPINVAKDPDYPAQGEDKELKDVREIQLTLDYGAYRKYLNKTVVVSGTLFHGFTVHHKTDAVMMVKEVRAAD